MKKLGLLFFLLVPSFSFAYVNGGASFFAKAISLDVSHSCVVGTELMRCWGLEVANEVTGLANYPSTKVEEVAVGPNQTCLIENKMIKCWGEGYEPTGTTLDGFIDPSNLALGEGFGCVVDKYKIKCWGKNAELIQKNMPQLMNVKALRTSGKQMCAVDTQLECWSFAEAQIFSEFTQTIKKPRKVEFVKRANGSSSLCALNDTTVSCASTLEVDATQKYSDISYGGTHLCALSKTEIDCTSRSYKIRIPNNGEYQYLVAGANLVCAYGSYINCWHLQDDKAVAADLKKITDLSIQTTDLEFLKRNVIFADHNFEVPGFEKISLLQSYFDHYLPEGSDVFISELNACLTQFSQTPEMSRKFVENKESKCSPNSAAQIAAKKYVEAMSKISPASQDQEVYLIAANEAGLCFFSDRVQKVQSHYEYTGSYAVGCYSYGDTSLKIGEFSFKTDPIFPHISAYNNNVPDFGALLFKVRKPSPLDNLSEYFIRIKEVSHIPKVRFLELLLPLIDKDLELNALQTLEEQMSILRSRFIVLNVIKPLIFTGTSKLSLMSLTDEYNSYVELVVTDYPELQLNETPLVSDQRALKTYLSILKNVLVRSQKYQVNDADKQAISTLLVALAKVLADPSSLNEFRQMLIDQNAVMAKLADSPKTIFLYEIYGVIQNRLVIGF